MTFLDKLNEVMEQVRAEGNEFIRMDVLAVRLGEVSTTSELTPGEVLMTKLKILEETGKMGAIKFPWEVVPWRGSTDRGYSFEKVEYKKVDLMENDPANPGKKRPQTNENGEPKVQRYYWPILAWKNPEREQTTRALDSLRETLSQHLPAGFVAVLDKDGPDSILVIRKVITNKTIAVDQQAA